MFTFRADPVAISGLRCPPPMFGEHNVSNALAGIAVATRWAFRARRCRRTGVLHGCETSLRKPVRPTGISVIDDYGHHPVEILAVLRAAVRPRKGASSQSSNRTAIAVLKGLLKSSAPASAMRMRSLSRMCTRLVKRLWKVSTETPWCWSADAWPSQCGGIGIAGAAAGPGGFNRRAGRSRGVPWSRYDRGWAHDLPAALALIRSNGRRLVMVMAAARP